MKRSWIALSVWKQQPKKVKHEQIFADERDRRRLS
jgi:hypothetical protein